MKTRIPFRIAPSCMACSLIFVLHMGGGAQASQLFWNPGGSGGDEFWSTTPGDKNWNAVPGDPAGNVTWQDGADDVAVFDDMIGGTVTVFDSVQAAGIIQDDADYIIEAGTIVLAADSSSNAPSVHVQSGTLTIKSALDGGDGMVKTGSGTLLLTAENPYIGTTAIQGGSVNLTGSLASNSVRISNGASLLNQTNGLSSGATLTNAGSLTLNSNDTVLSYISNGGSLTTGAGTLSARTVELNNGSIIAGQLYADEITSNGAVSMSGIVTGKKSTNVQSGTLNLTGTLTTTNLNIADGATLIQNGNIGPISVGSAVTAVTNSGSLVVQESAVFKTYVSNGGLLDVQGGRMITQTVELNDGSLTKGGSFSANLITTNGAVRIENSALGARTVVASGTLDLVGSLGTSNVEISNIGNLLVQNGGLRFDAAVTNAGTLTLLNSDQITNYTSNGGLVNVQEGNLNMKQMMLNEGSVVRGSARADQLVSQGNVRIEGRVIGDSANIAGGILTLTGTLGFTETSIASGATLHNQGGEFTHTISLTNSGTLDLQSDATARDYISNGGTLTAGTGTLFATRADLNNGSTLAGQLNTDTLTSNGAVLLSGTISAGTVSIQSGMLTNTGMLGNASTLLNIHQGASLVAGGVQQYAMLTTSGPGAATWSGDLTNRTTLAPGGLGEIGRLDVSGNWANAPAGILRMDLSAAQSDYLSVSGIAKLDGILDLNQAAGAAIASFVPVQIIGASVYSGNFTSITENLDGAVWFNPGNGTVTRLAFPTGGGSSLFGITDNQSASWISLYDDVIDPGTTNITANPGGNPPYDISSGIASADSPDLLWALAASFTPGGLDRNLLNRLSPEVYTGFSDYGTQATRSHQRAALDAPALASTADDDAGSKSGLHSAKSGAKDALPSPVRPGIEFFAALDSFHVETDNSLNDGNYALDGTGVIAGMRGHPLERFTLAGYLAGNDGTVDGSLINADTLGWSMGLIGEWLIDAKSSTRVLGAVSYGSYTFDGERDSASATIAGWAPGDIDFSDVRQDSLELFLGIDSTSYQDETFRLIPSAGLRYASGFMDEFRENTSSAPASPIALGVAGDHHESMLVELALLAEMDWNDRLTLRGQIGANAGLITNDHVLRASFVDGDRPMHITAEGLNDDLFFLSLGAEYHLGDSASIGFGYRSEFRASHHTLHGFSLSSTFRF